MDYNEMFANMGKAQINGKGTKLGDGHYTLRSRVMKVKKGGHWGDTFIFEFDVVRSANPDHPIGSNRTATVNMGKQQAFGDIKAMIFALLMQVDPATVKGPEVDPETHGQATNFFKAIVEPGNVAQILGADFADFTPAGFLVDVDVELVKTQAGHDWARHKWSPTPDDVADAIEAAPAG